MTPNTKIGLLVGLVFIIGIGMLLSQQGQANRDMSQLVPDRPAQEQTASGERPGGTMLAGPRFSPPGTSFTPGEPPRHSVAPPPVPPPYSLPPGLEADRGSRPDPIVDHHSLISPIQPGPITLTDRPQHVAEPPLPPGWRMHKVQAGETLSAISTKYYQTSRNFELIYSVNKDKMPNVNTIREGMEIRIPPASPPIVAVAPPAPPAPPSPQPGALATPRSAPPSAVGGPVVAGTYRVKDGDTLYSIAASLMGGRSQWRALYEANADVLSNPDRLKVGQTLKVPQPRLALQN